MKKDPEKIIVRHNGKGNCEVVRIIYTKFGPFTCMIAPNISWEEGYKIVEALKT